MEKSSLRRRAKKTQMKSHINWYRKSLSSSSSLDKMTQELRERSSRRKERQDREKWEKDLMKESDDGNSSHVRSDEGWEWKKKKKSREDEEKRQDKGLSFFCLLLPDVIVMYTEHTDRKSYLFMSLQVWQSGKCFIAKLTGIRSPFRDSNSEGHLHVFCSDRRLWWQRRQGWERRRGGRGRHWVQMLMRRRGRSKMTRGWLGMKMMMTSRTII